MIQLRSRRRSNQIAETPGSHAAEPPGYWSSDFVHELEEVLRQAREGTPLPLEQVISAGRLLYLHYVDRLEWYDAERVLSLVVDLPGADQPGRPDHLFDIVNALHAVHLSLWGRNGLGAGSALARLGQSSATKRSPLGTGALAAIAFASGDYEHAVACAERAKASMVKSGGVSPIDRLMISWWDEVIARSNGALKPAPISFAQSVEKPARIPSTRIERAAVILANDRFAWDPGVPSDFRAEWIWRRRPVADFS